MALATRCPHCHTTFRVVHDQLKLRSGMVRCGQCQHIFNGIEHLIRAAQPETNASTATTARPAPDLNPPPPVKPAPAVPPVPVPPVPVPPPVAAPEPVALSVPAHEPEDPPHQAENAPDNQEVAQAAPVQVPTHAPAPATTVATSMPELPDTLQFGLVPPPAHAPQDHATPADEPGHDEPILPTVHEDGRIEPHLDDGIEARIPIKALEVTAAVENLEQSSAHEIPDSGMPEPDEPSFVKAGRRQQKWRGFWIALQSTLSLFLLLTLLAQATYLWRDQIAARWPITLPHLKEMCALVHCQIGLPTQIQELSIELGELQALPRDKNTFSYATLLRNHSNLPQTWPNIELSLLDQKEHVIARRVFVPHDYLPSESKGFAAQSEHAVKLYFETSPQLKAQGYLAAIFYP